LNLIKKGLLICSKENTASQFVAGGLVTVLQTEKLSSMIFEEGTVSTLVIDCPLQSSTSYLNFCNICISTFEGININSS